MYRLTYYGKSQDDSDQATDILRTVSLDEGLDSLPPAESTVEEETKLDSESEHFLKATFGDDLLSKMLTEVAERQPNDPIMFLASLLEKASETEVGTRASYVRRGNRRRSRKTDVNGKIAHFIEV